jgi:ABC-type lipoprotein export system ATPase subunit
LLSAIDLNKSHRSREGRIIALETLTLSIKRKDFLMVTGPSGSGKSTLLNLLSGLDSPSEGEVTFEGQMMSTVGGDGIARLRNEAFGFIFQTPHLLPDRTVLENVALPFQYGSPVSSDNQKSRCVELLSYVDLLDLADRYPNSLSGGEMQRVVVARALCRRPKVIFADEPTGSLDEENSLKIVGLLKEQANQGCSVVMATHDEGLLRWGNRRLQLNKTRGK